MKRLAVYIVLFLSVLSVKAQYKVIFHFKDSVFYRNSWEIDSITFEEGELMKVAASEAKKIKRTSSEIDVTLTGDLTLLDKFGLIFATEESNLQLDNKNAKTMIYSQDFYTQDFSVPLTNLEYNTTYYYKPFAEYQDTCVYGAVKSFTSLTEFPVPDEPLDLGLSVKWAPWNVGASCVGDYGDYYGWGDSSGHVVSNNSSDYAKGNTSSNITRTSYDIAYVHWGGKWRLPTVDEVQEMVKACKWTSTSSYVEDGDSTGVAGWVGKAPNGVEIFIPRAGYKSNGTSKVLEFTSEAWYWTGSANASLNAYVCQILNGIAPSDYSSYYHHNSIRPVYDENMTGGGSSGGGSGQQTTEPAYVDLGLSVYWAKTNIGAKNEYDYGDYYAWGELDTDSVFTKASYDYWVDNAYVDLTPDIACDTLYDVATKKYGEAWHMPTEEQMLELVDTNKCSRVWTAVNGVKGYKITSKVPGYVGKSIFLPAAGYKNGLGLQYEGTTGKYRTSTDYMRDSEWVMSLGFTSEGTFSVMSDERKDGFSIRAVRNKE